MPTPTPRNSLTNVPEDRGLPNCPKCGGDVLRSQSDDNQQLDFNCISTKCSACGSHLLIQMRAARVQILDSLGQSDVTVAAPEDDSLFSWWQRLPNRNRWLLALYAFMLSSSVASSFHWYRGGWMDFIVLAFYYALASLLGLWASSGPKLSVERLCLAIVGILFLSGLLSASGEFPDIPLWSPAVFPYIMFAALRPFGWRIRKVVASNQHSPFRFSIRQLMVLTVVISLIIVFAQQFFVLLRIGDDQYWAPIAAGLLTAPVTYVIVLSMLGLGRIFSGAIVAFLTCVAAGILTAIVIGPYLETSLVVLIWFQLYFAFCSLPLLAMRPAGYRFIKLPRPDSRSAS